MKIVGCDLHARQQTIAMMDTETGELTEKALSREGNAVRAFLVALAVSAILCGGNVTVRNAGSSALSTTRAGASG